MDTLRQMARIRQRILRGYGTIQDRVDAVYQIDEMIAERTGAPAKRCSLPKKKQREIGMLSEVKKTK